MQTRRQQNSQTTFRLLAGWCGLLFYVAAFSPLGMLAGVILGTLDSDHQVLIQPGASGMKLVMRHEGDCAAHQHHSVARALTFFAQPVSEANPDHVIQFAGGEGIWSDPAKTISGDEVEDGLNFKGANHAIWQSCSTKREIPPAGPPPDATGTLLNVRFTVLLI